MRNPTSSTTRTKRLSADDENDPKWGQGDVLVPWPTFPGIYSVPPEVIRFLNSKKFHAFRATQMDLVSLIVRKSDLKGNYLGTVETLRHSYCLPQTPIPKFRRILKTLEKRKIILLEGNRIALTSDTLEYFLAIRNGDLKKREKDLLAFLRQQYPDEIIFGQSQKGVSL